MSSSYSRRAAVVVIAAISTGGAQVQQAVYLKPVENVQPTPSELRIDVRQFPPLAEEFYSEDSPRSYKLLCFAKHQSWDSRTSIGRLERLRPGEGVRVWKTVFPNSYRPKFILVTSAAMVVTFDDWENVRSQNAIVIYSPTRDGKLRQTFRYSLDEVSRRLGIEVSEMVAANTYGGYGWWLQAEPLVAQDRERVLIKVANRTAQLTLSSGTLALVDSSGADIPDPR